jgi:transforming growth factor-beta-induced protein
MACHTNPRANKFFKELDLLEGGKTMKQSVKLFLFLMLGLILAACQSTQPAPSAMQVMEGDERLDTFMSAMNENGDMMAEGKSYTIFAPTTDAFIKYFSESGLSAEDFLNGDGLAKILSYHVAEGSLKAADIIKAGKVKTVEGSDITVTSDGTNVLLNGTAKVLEADKTASNAVIHIIDTVLMPPAKTLPNIVEIAASDARFSTLVAAVTKAGLVDTLSSKGPFTVFAPTNDAFAALLAKLGITAEQLLASPDLAGILTYHVVAGKVTAADVVKLNKATTVNGKDVMIEVKDGNVILNGSIKVIITDIMASNGVIHVIDGVLLPPADPKPSIVDIAVGNPDFSTLVAALQAADLVDALSADGPFTVFAPTNAAFEKLADSLHLEVADLLELPNLSAILLYHVAEGAVKAEQALDLGTIETLNGATVEAELRGADVFINDSKVIAADIEASNGVIHVIDTVLLPPARH